MEITPIKQLKVGIVPSWLNQLIVMSTDIDYKDLLCYDSLLANMSSILTEEQVLIYVITQEYLAPFTEKAFVDQIGLSELDENLAFIRTHEMALDKVSDKLKVNTNFSGSKIGDVGAIASVNFLAKEYYQPLLIDDEYLLLIGNSFPIYENNRAFYNALVETVAKSFDLANFKRFELFKRYLRHAVTN